jgi:flavin-dependent dehydrogenase
MKNTNTDYHVVIVGAGVAGLTAALVLAKNGLKVAIIESKNTHASKMGECVQASLLNTLDKLGLRKQFEHDNHFQLQGYKVNWDEHGLYERNLLATPSGTGWLLNREKFDNMLVKATKLAGVDIYWQSKLAELHEVKNAESGYQSSWKLDIVSLEKKWRLDVPFIVDGTGRARNVARQLVIVKPKKDNLVACFCRIEHSQSKILTNQQAVIQSSEQGWWYLAPYSERYASLCYFTDPDLPLPKSAEDIWTLAVQQTQLNKHLIDSVVAHEHDFKVVAAYSSCLESCVEENWLAIGDAACSYDPLSSYGITSAMGSAFYAAKAIVKTFNGQPEFLDVYQSLMQTNFKNYLTERNTQYQKVTQFNSLFWDRRRAQ